MKYILILSLLFSQITLASCPEAVQLIKKDEIANCTGYLYSPKADEIANDVFEEAESLKEENTILKEKSKLIIDRNKILEQRLELYFNQSEVLAKQLTRKENRSEWQKVLYFGLGVLATGLAANAVKGL